VSVRNDPRRRELAAYPFSVAVPVRFGDMDIFRHVNNVAIARFYEEGRLRFMASLRAEDEVFANTAFRLIVAHVGIDYLGEAGYPEDITVGVAVASLGNTSFRYAEALFQQGRCIGLAEVVLTHLESGKPTALPETVRAALGRYLLRA
jgi:acyl-CoA thioester hydrolase